MIPATPEIARALRQMKRRRIRHRVLLIILAVMTIAAILLTTCLHPMRHTGRAMVPTLRDGQLIFINMLDHTPEAGQIVLFSREAPEGGAMVRRVIALPGDVVSLTTSGALLVNGEPILTIPAGNADMPETLLIPDGHLFVLGDNTVEALDSRLASVGLLRTDEVQGTVW